MKRTLKDIREELLETLKDLEESYLNSPETDKEKISYVNVKMCEHLLNMIKSVDYHYRESVPELRTKKKQGPEILRATKLMKKYGELSDESNKWSDLQLKLKYDTSGYLAQREFFSEAVDSRADLKRKQ